MNIALKPTRRAVLAWGGVLAASIALPQAARADEPNTFGITAAGLTSVLVPGENQSIDVPRDLGLSIEGPLPAGTEIIMSYDPRLYRASDNVVLTTQGRALSKDAFIASFSTGSVSLTLVQPVPSGTITILAGQLTPRRYPNDIVRDLTPATASKKVPGHAGKKSSQLGQDKKGQKSGEPWGAECGALWDALHWGAGYRYFRPLSASVRSVGPGPVPAGSVLEILADDRVVRDFAVVSAVDASGLTVPGRTKPIKIAGVSGVQWILDAEVPAGGQVLLRLTSTVAVPSGALDGAKNPIISISAPSEWIHNQRTTYRDNIHRNDIIVTAAALSEAASFTAEGNK